MLFNSIEFLFFFPIVTLIYFLIPQRFRWLHLLIASCIFYCAFIPVYILILFFTIIIDYIAGIFIEQARGHKRRLFLLLSIVANVGVLAVFKYYNFLIGNMNELLSGLHICTHPVPLLNIILPIGLSFHTFQAMSYTIEVYRGNQSAERHFGIYALYVMFYPQLVAGPIERPQNLLHQFREEHPFNYDRVVSGLRLMAWGLFKKMTIADRLAILVNQIYHSPENASGMPVVLATLFFSIQIYCDFSGYSDIAIGAARVMGFTLMKNFNLPYFSKSVSEFWTRWHISLSTWFRDYVYIPLGGNRVNKARWYYNLFVVFMLSGLWHGANWTFIFWGALHGTYLIFGHMTTAYQNRVKEKSFLKDIPRLTAFAEIISVFSLTTFAWIFFRAKSFHDAVLVIKHLWGTSRSYFEGSFHYGFNSFKIFYTRTDWIFLAVGMLILFSGEIVQRKHSPNRLIARLHPVVRWSIYYVFLLFILFGRQTGKTQFIYFQF